MGVYMGGCLLQNILKHDLFQLNTDINHLISRIAMAYTELIIIVRHPSSNSFTQ